MGWNAGSLIMDDLINALIAADISDDQRKIIYEKIYESFRDMDWDTVDECLGVDFVFDNVVRSIEPEWFDEDQEDSQDEEN